MCEVAYNNEPCDHEGCQPPTEEASGPVTVLALALFRGAKESETGGITMGAIEGVGLPFMGGCARCGACIAAYNACPSTTGYIMCRSGCIGDDGYETVEKANIALFPEEYEWKGVRST